MGLMQRLRSPLAIARDAESEEGIGLVEIVISMFLLGLVAISFLPLLLRTMTVSTVNTSTSSSSQLVQASMDQVRSLTTCSTVTSFASATLATVTDARGVVLQPSRQLIGACPTSYPGTVTVRAYVTQSGSSTVLAEATALVYVTAAN